MDFSDRLRQQMQSRGLKSITITRATGASRSSVSQWVNGTAKPSGVNLTKLCEFLQCDASWLMYGEQSLNQTYPPAIPIARSLMNNAATETILGGTRGRTFRFSFTQNLLYDLEVEPRNAAYVIMEGDSMEPVFPGGSILGVDTAMNTVTDGGIYLINHEGLMRIKIISKIPGSGLKLRSYNNVSYPEEEHTGREAKKIEIVGKVFFYASSLT